jgi:hypothetical protein
MSRSHVWVINIFFAVCAVVFGFRAWNIWFSDASAVSPVPGGDMPGFRIPYAGLTERQIVPSSEYDAVVNRNLFSADRKEVKAAGTSDPSQNQEPSAGKHIRLYGVFMTDAAKTAIIDASDQPDKRKALRVREGDSVQNVKIISIQPDRIIVSEGEGQKVIPLYAENKSILREAVEKSDKTTLLIKGGDSGTPEVVQPEPAVQKTEPDQTVKPPEEEYETINTPFGPIKRRKQ